MPRSLLRLAACAGLFVMKELVAQNGGGGVIAMDRKGNLATPFNTPGMYRAWGDE
jgi:beta-aspartyl-peptidase (threonine type)